MVAFRGAPLPVVRLSTVLGIAGRAATALSRLHRRHRRRRGRPARRSHRRPARDRRALDGRSADSRRGVAGATDLGDGRAVLILDAAARRARGPRRASAPRGWPRQGDRMTRRRSLHPVHRRRHDLRAAQPGRGARRDGRAGHRACRTRRRSSTAWCSRAARSCRRSTCGRGSGSSARRSTCATRLLVVQSQGRTRRPAGRCLPRVPDDSAASSVHPPGEALSATERAVHRRRRDRRRPPRSWCSTSSVARDRPTIAVQHASATGKAPGNDMATNSNGHATAARRLRPGSCSARPSR